MHRGTSARHRNVKLCFVRLTKRPNRHADNDLIDGLGLACVTGDNYSLVDMQRGAVANDLAFVECDLALINADNGPQLVVEELLPAVFEILREPTRSPIKSVIFPPLEHAEVPRLVERLLLLDANLTAAANRFVAAIWSKLRLLCRAEILCFSQSFALRSRHPGLEKERCGRSLPQAAVSRVFCLWLALP